MWARHLLIACVSLAGFAFVGSQLRKPELTNADVSSETMLTAADVELVQRIDAEFETCWSERALPSAALADNLQIVRRLSLSLTGSLPSLEELRVFESIEVDQQVDWWLNRLLQDQRYSDYVAERLARAFVGTEGGPFIVFRRRRFVAWLSDQLTKNTPYDEVVRSLISDRGSWTDSPAVNFITVTNDTNEEGQPDPARLAARTTRAFLGVRLDCMQCHDDHLGGDWLQSDFHQLAAFFAEARSSGLGIRDTKRDYEFKYLHAEETQTVRPALPFDAEIRVSGNTQREQLAAWVTHPENKAFARASVNRIWALLLGRPLVEPIDDIPLTGPYPPGLELLADSFVANGFDLRSLIAQIASTRPFHLQSRANFEVTEAHTRNWSVFPLTRLRPEQMAGAVLQSASLKTIDSNSHVLVRFVRFTQIEEFVKRYGDTGEDEFADHGGTIPQRLVMLNGKLVKERTKDDFPNAATRIGSQVKDNAHAVEIAFLVALTRRPTTDELEHFSAWLGEASDTKREHVMEDVFWSLLNSAEFSWNH